MKRTLAVAITSSAMLGSLLLTGVASAQTPSTPTGEHEWGGHMGGMKPGVFGTVSAISGNTITVDSKGFGKTPTATTYSVDATNATVTKSGAASSLASVAVGDMVMVQGTVSGTSVTATAVRDGVMMGMRGGPGHSGMDMASSTLPQGNGQPVVGGSVTAISGSTLTITNKSNVTYTVDASSSTVNKSGQTSSLSNVVVGDAVVVQGVVNGNSVVASSVIDQGAPKTSTSTEHKGFGGFMGGLGGFFQHLFGFF